MPRKKKEETPEVTPDKKEVKKVSPYGWTAVRNKAKFTHNK